MECFVNHYLSNSMGLLTSVSTLYWPSKLCLKINYIELKPLTIQPYLYNKQLLNK